MRKVNRSRRIVILGAGITGLTIANELSRRYSDDVLVLEKQTHTGGLAATYCAGEHFFDLGSHRLHEKSPRHILGYIEGVLGEPLLKRKRQGRLYHRGRYMRYPPSLLSFISSFSLSENIHFLMSYAVQKLLRADAGRDDFEQAMVSAVGESIYKAFYEGFARKLWGQEPCLMSTDAMKRRKIFSGVGWLARRLLKRSDHFYYPRNGIGDIALSLAKSVLQNGGVIVTGAKVTKIHVAGRRVRELSMSTGEEVVESKIEPHVLVSTIPIDDLWGLLWGADERSGRLRWRGLRLLYLHIKEEPRQHGETFYFPSPDVTIGRVSNINKYSPFLNPSASGTLLTVEIPSSHGDRIATMKEDELVHLCAEELVKVKVLDRYPTVFSHFSVQLDKVYPLYELGWKNVLMDMCEKLHEISNLFTLGRSGLFLHCNIDHCISQGLTLSQIILRDEWWNKDVWHGKVCEFLKFCARD